MAEPTETVRFQTDNTLTQKPQPRQQLSKSMEHMRFAVTVDPIPHPSTPTLSPPAEEPAPESDAYGVPASFAPIRQTPARSQSPSNTEKRTSPFAFGSRLLEEGDDIFQFNAWDHVSVDPSYLDFSATQYAQQRAEPVSDFDRQRFNANPEKWWNLFYKNNRTNFFKNRKWLAQEFPILDAVTKADAAACTLLEVGAGAGNSAFPILEKNRNPGLKIHACDFSKKAVELIRAHERYDNGKHIQADVWDVASAPSSENAGLPPGLQENSVDVVLMIFIFSALNPEQWNQAVRNIYRVLKPGGQVLFRDYGRGDLAQVRFKKGRWMGENFYVRGDGTRVYFFERGELEEIWGGEGAGALKEGSSQEAASQEGTSQEATSQEATPQTTTPQAITSPESQSPTNAVPDLSTQTSNLSLNNPNTTSPEEQNHPTPRQRDPIPTPTFEVVHFGVDRRMLVNRQRRLKMYRCWMQAVFRKPGHQSEVETSTIRRDKEDGETRVVEG